MMKMDTECFIAAVKSRPVIWMSRHPRHKFKKDTKQQWEEIKKLMPGNPDVEDLKKKWKNLKDAYRKELKKVSMLQSADPLATNIQSNWVHYEFMDFLRAEVMLREDWDVYSPHTLKLPAVQVKEERPQSVEHVTIEIVKTEGLDYTETPMPPPPPLVPQVEQPLLSQRVSKPRASPERRSSSSSSETEADQQPPKKKPKPNDLRTEYLEIERKKLKILENEMANQNSNKDLTKSDDYHFFMSLLPEIAKLAPLQRFRLRNKINQIVIDEMSANMNGNYSHNT